MYTHSVQSEKGAFRTCRTYPECKFWSQGPCCCGLWCGHHPGRRPGQPGQGPASPPWRPQVRWSQSRQSPARWGRHARCRRRVAYGSRTPPPCVSRMLAAGFCRLQRNTQVGFWYHCILPQDISWLCVHCHGETFQRMALGLQHHEIQKYDPSATKAHAEV